MRSAFVALLAISAFAQPAVSSLLDSTAGQLAMNQASAGSTAFTVIGFGVEGDSEAAEKLSALAQAGGGRLLLASDSTELVRALEAAVTGRMLAFGSAGAVVSRSYATHDGLNVLLSGLVGLVLSLSAALLLVIRRRSGAMQRPKL